MIGPPAKHQAQMQKDEARLVIPPPSFSFSLLNLLTLALFYVKIDRNWYIQWWIVFCPTTLFVIYKVLACIKDLRKIQTFAGKVSRSDIKLYMLWKLSQLLIFPSLLLLIFFLGKFLDRLDNGDTLAFESFKHIVAITAFILLIYYGYSYAVKKEMTNALLPYTTNEESQPRQSAIFQYLMNIMFSVMGNTMTYCAGGACNSIYISTVSTFFSAFGIPIVEYIHYISFLAFFFILITLFSLYTVKRSWKYGPFIVSTLGALLILTDMLLYDLDYLTYVGNAMMIGCAIWNSKLNKHRFGFGAKKTNTG